MFIQSSAWTNLLDVILLGLLIGLFVGILETWFVFIWVGGEETLDGQ